MYYFVTAINIIIYNVILHFLQSKQDFQPQNPILHPLRGTIPQPEPNVSDTSKILSKL